MKKIATILAVLVSLNSFSQKKDSAKAPKDTVILVRMDINQFRQLLYAIDVNIDSKKASGEIIQFLQKSAMIDEKKKP